MDKKTVIDFQGDNDVLFWKSPVEQLGVDSKIIVPETHYAIFIKDGQLFETLDAGKYDIFDKSSKFFGLIKTKGDIDSVKVVFISKTAKLKILWGTPQKFDMRDPLYGVAIQLGVSGSIELQISNPRKFALQVVGAEDKLTIDDVKKRVQDRLIAEIEPIIAKTVKENKVSYVEFGEYKKSMSEIVKTQIEKVFEDEYSLKVCSFIISHIILSNEEKAMLENKRAELLKESEKENAGVATGDKFKFCSECGAKIIEESKFCGECGAKILLGDKCKACGEMNVEGAKFCRMCGKKVK